MARADDTTDRLVRDPRATPPLPACPARPGDPCAWEQAQPEIARWMRTIAADLATVRESIAALRPEVHLLRDLPTRVTRLEETVATLRLVVFSAVGLILVAVVGALLALVVARPASPVMPYQNGAHHAPAP